MRVGENTGLSANISELIKLSSIGPFFMLNNIVVNNHIYLFVKNYNCFFNLFTYIGVIFIFFFNIFLQILLKISHTLHILLLISRIYYFFQLRSNKFGYLLNQSIAMISYGKNLLGFAQFLGNFILKINQFLKFFKTIR